MEENNNGKKVLGYVRVASFEDTIDMERQISAIETYCKGRNISHYLTFTEEGSRGISWEVIEEIAKNSKGVGVDIVVADMERISSDVGWLLLKQGELEGEYGVNIVSVSGKNFGLDKDGEMSIGR